MDIKDLQLNALLEVTQAINNNLPEADLFKIYKFTLLADLKVDKLALYTEPKDKWICQVCYGAAVDFCPLQLPEKYLNLQKQELVSGADEFSEFDCVFPVHHKSKLLAVVFISTKTDEIITKNRFLNALTNIIMVAIENKKLARKEIEQEAYKREMDIAKDVQLNLFPNVLPDSEKLHIQSYYFPNKEVGGDYYDYIPISDTKFMVCIADVSGKGVPAALLMSNFHAALHTLTNQGVGMKKTVKELNKLLFKSGNAQNFITFFALTYDFETKEAEYINCGHNEAYLKTKNEVQLLTEGTTILGMLQPLPFIKTSKIKNLEKFHLFLYTDGVTETENEFGDFFGEERLHRLVSLERQGADMLHENVLEALEVFKGNLPYNDDVTMLSCQVNNG